MNITNSKQVSIDKNITRYEDQDYQVFLMLQRTPAVAVFRFAQLIAEKLKTGAERKVTSIIACDINNELTAQFHKDVE